MARYKTSVDFIHACNKSDQRKRLVAISRNTKFPLRILERHEEEIDRVAQFIASVDKKFHRFAEKVPNDIFLEGTFHNHISSDFRSLILLGVTDQNYQANIVLRHLIDNWIITLWADIICDCRGAFHHFLNTEEWKPYRSTQRVTWEPERNFPNRSVKERLERIRLLNFISAKKETFYKRYFATASRCELFILLSLPICEECISKRVKEVNYNKFHWDASLAKKGKEDIHAKYRSDFRLICCFCNKQKLTKGFAWGIPDSTDMLDMLKFLIKDDRLKINLSMIQKLYSHLSEDYVHFSTTVVPDFKPDIHDFEGKRGLIWGLDGVLFFLEILNPLVDYYFKVLRSASKIA